LEERTLQEKRLLLVKVMKGKNKPYLFKGRAYVRVNGTNRIATRFELDEMYRQKSCNTAAE